MPRIGWLRTGYLGCIAAVRKKLKTIKPHLVHGQGTERDCGISAVFSGYPNVITTYGNMAQLARTFHARLGSFYWWASKLENFTLPRTLGVICNSAHTSSLVSSRAKATRTVPNLLRSSFFQNTQIKHLPSSQLTFLVVGVITLNKRQLELLDLFTRLHDYYACFSSLGLIEIY